MNLQTLLHVEGRVYTGFSEFLNTHYMSL